jgi:hypothetical protein
LKPQIEATAAVVRLLAARELLAPLVRLGTERQIGRRAVLMAFALGAGPCKTQRALAARLGVTEARISQELKPVRAHFRALIPE